VFDGRQGLIGAGFGALIHLGWKILKALGRIEERLGEKRS
jgi:hypothetical protein